MDFRFHSAIRDWLVSQGLKDQYDLVSLAGATKGLVEKDASSTEIILKQIDISTRLHAISEVYIMHHMDCGAYGGHQAFDSLQAEHDKQVADMAAAKKIMAEKFPQLQIKNILARIEDKDGQASIDFQMI
jgi:carbonic anhydrase